MHAHARRPFRHPRSVALVVAFFALLASAALRAQTLDFGDAPAPYPTTLAADGARHTATGPRLGVNRDAEANGQPSPTGNGDDNTGIPDDEDGVAFPTITAGGYVAFGLVASAAAKVDVWIDFNRDGDWNDAGERVADAADVAAGTNLLNFRAPDDLALAPGTSTPTAARVRLSTAGHLAPTGAAADGEVEDYAVTLSAPASATNVRAGYANGQVFIVWNYDTTFAPESFDVYASATPFSSTSAAGVTHVGRLFEPEYSGSHLLAQMLSAYGPANTPSGYRIPDGNGGFLRLASGQGLFVTTVRTNASRYFAVVPHGQSTVSATNRTPTPVTETFSLAQPPTYYAQSTGNNRGHVVSYYVVWVDGDDNASAGRSDFPIMANAARAGIPRLFLAIAPTGGLSATTKNPAMMLTHGGDARANMWLPDSGTFDVVGLEDYPGLLFAMEDKIYRISAGRIDDGFLFWFGWAPSWDPFTNTALPPDNAVIVNYTHRWGLWTMDWLIANPAFNLDPERIAGTGHSAGALALLQFTRSYPERFSSVTMFDPNLQKSVDVMPAAFGTPAQNLLTSQIAPSGAQIRINQITDLLASQGPRDIPFSRIFLGQREANWATDDNRDHQPDGLVALRAADPLGLGYSFYWDLREHGTNLWTYAAMTEKLNGTPTFPLATWTIADFWIPTVATQMRRDDGIHQTRYRARQSFPAFFNFARYPNHGDFGTCTYPNNQGTYFDRVTEYLGTLTPQDHLPPNSGADDRGTWGGYHEWEPSTIVDTSTKWEATLWLINNAVQTNLAAVETSPQAQLTADVAIRKPQLFKPAPGATVSWKVTNAATSALLQSGTATVAADGLVSIVGVTVLRDPNKVKLTIEGPPAISAPASSQSIALGASATFTAAPEGTGPFAYQWMFNGTVIAGATSSTYARVNVQPAHAGNYSVVVANALGSTTSRPAVLGIASTAKVAGNATEFAANITHPNGNIYDQVLLNGAAATVTADPGQVTRTSFIDLSNDIVQVEFSGAGTLTITLENVSGPAVAVNYNQPTVQYVKGHATLTLAGANETTHVSAFTVGTATAVNQTIFVAGVAYDGVADLALLNAQSPTARLGSIRMANTEFSAASGLTGVNAPGVRVGGPANIHNISASSSASPLLLTGVIDSGQIGITGGDLLQPNAKAIEFGTAQKVAMLAGATSHNVAQPAQINKGVLARDGVVVTGQVIQNP